MPMTAAVLYEAIVDAGCPTSSTNVEDGNDRATWSFVPKENATSEQIEIGNNVIATIPIEPLGIIATEEFIARFTNSEYLALEKKRAADIAANKIGNAKNWDVVIAASTVDMNKKKVETLKADLVTDGVLTQTRADEIFS